jgi:hypothetical protein
VTALKLLLDDHKSGRILFCKDIKELSDELKDQLQREDSAHSSLTLQHEILVYEKKKITKLCESEFQNNQYDSLLKIWVRERQRLLSCRKEYIQPNGMTFLVDVYLIFRTCEISAGYSEGPEIELFQFIGSWN